MQFPHVTQLVATMVSGKLKVVKALSAGIELNHLGDPKASLDDVMKESTHFIGAWYGQKCDPSDTMYSVRYKVWVSRSGRKWARILPKLKSLPQRGLFFKLAFGKLHCNRFQQSWIHVSLDGHPKDHQVHIAQCHYQVKLKLLLQIYLSWSTAYAAVTGHAHRKDAVVHLRSWLVHCSAGVKAAQPAAIPRLFP